MILSVFDLLFESVWWNAQLAVNPLLALVDWKMQCCGSVIRLFSSLTFNTPTKIYFFLRMVKSRNSRNQGFWLISFIFWWWKDPDLRGQESYRSGSGFPTLKDVNSGYHAGLKGTVRPDWICMRVVSLESPLKAHKPLLVFNFFYFTLEYFKRLQSPEPLVDTYT